MADNIGGQAWLDRQAAIFAQISNVLETASGEELKRVRSWLFIMLDQCKDKAAENSVDLTKLAEFQGQVANAAFQAAWLISQGY